MAEVGPEEMNFTNQSLLDYTQSGQYSLDLDECLASYSPH